MSGPGFYLLELTNGLADQAPHTWSPLDRLPQNDALRVLKDGLISLAHDQFEEAMEKLNRGLALNQDHPLINVYVRAVVEKLSEQ